MKIKVYTPWCINCDAVSKQIEQLAKHFEGLDSVIFARIDASLNEHPKLQVCLFNYYFFVFALVNTHLFPKVPLLYSQGLIPGCFCGGKVSGGLDWQSLLQMIPI